MLTCRASSDDPCWLCGVQAQLVLGSSCTSISRQYSPTRQNRLCILHGVVRQARQTSVTAQTQVALHGATSTEPPTQALVWIPSQERRNLYNFSCILHEKAIVLACTDLWAAFFCLRCEYTCQPHLWSPKLLEYNKELFSRHVTSLSILSNKYACSILEGTSKETHSIRTVDTVFAAAATERTACPQTGREYNLRVIGFPPGKRFRRIPGQLLRQ